MPDRTARARCNTQKSRARIPMGPRPSGSQGGRAGPAQSGLGSRLRRPGRERPWPGGHFSGGTVLVGTVLVRGTASARNRVRRVTGCCGPCRGGTFPGRQRRPQVLYGAGAAAAGSCSSGTRGDAGRQQGNTGRNCRTRGSGPAPIPGSPRGAPSFPVRRRRRARLR